MEEAVVDVQENGFINIVGGLLGLIGILGLIGLLGGRLCELALTDFLDWCTDVFGGSAALASVWNLRCFGLLC